jgi:L-asparaginase
MFSFRSSLAFALAGRINAKLDQSDWDGVVVTHGTDTMEESAYMADLLVRSDKPVVLTGVQRAADPPDTDGPRNVADSVQLAASPAAHGLGVMICFEQEFHAAPISDIAVVDPIANLINSTFALMEEGP